MIEMLKEYLAFLRGLIYLTLTAAFAVMGFAFTHFKSLNLYEFAICAFTLLGLMIFSAVLYLHYRRKLKDLKDAK